MIDDDTNLVCQAAKLKSNAAFLTPGLATLLFSVLLCGSANGAETVVLRSGNSAIGQLDSRIRFVSGQGPFSASDFAAARTGILATTVVNHPAWVVTLQGDPLAKWVAVDANRSALSALYAIDFTITSPATCNAKLELRYAVDNYLGRTGIPGLYLNGQPVPASPAGAGWFDREYVFSASNVGFLLHPGTNTFYFFQYDFGAVAGAIFSATITLPDDVLISEHPTSKLVCPSSNISFSALASGAGPFAYRWRKNGTPIDTGAVPSAGTPSLTLNAVQITDAGLYDCVVSSACGTATSNPADLDVYCNCPSFTATNGIADAFALPAETSPITASFTAALNNSNPRPLLKFDQIPEETAGTVGNQNIASSFTGVPADLLSATLTFRVKSGKEIQANAEGTDRMRLGFASGAGTSATFDVRWTRFFGIGNSTDAFFPGVQWGDSIDRTIALDLASLPRASQQGGGTISVLDEMTQRGFLDFVVDDDSGVDYMQLTGVRSGNGVKAAWIRSQPSDAAHCPANTTTLAVVAAGSGPFSYLWRKNGAPIDIATNPTAATATLFLNPGKTLDAGSYDCIISNSCNSVTSRAATLAICASDFNCDAAVDDADFIVFVAAYNVLLCNDPAMPANCPADLNGDGVVDDSDFTLFVVAYNALLCS